MDNEYKDYELNESKTETKDVKQEEKTVSFYKKLLRDWIFPAAAAIIIALLINKFLLFKIYVPTGSMVPTIMEKDQIFVTKIYNKASIKRGDVLVFYSEEFKDLLIKRVVGLPGEHVRVDDTGKVYIDEKLLPEPYVVNKS